MKNIFTALAAIALALPASAAPIKHKVIAYNEMMVLVPHLEYIGYSRISTVEACAKLTKTQDWTNMTTDMDLMLMEGCLIENT